MLYLVKSQNWYKIGCTRDLKRRMQMYMTHNPDFELIGTTTGYKVAEKKYHNSLSMYERRMEWFKLPEEKVEELKKVFRPTQYSWTIPATEYKLWCKKSKMNKNNESPVELVFYENGKRVSRTLGIRWNPLTFKEDSQTEPLKTKLETEIKKHIRDEIDI